MANDTNPDVQQDNRLRLQLAAIDRQKMQILRKLGSEKTRSFPRITSRSKDPAFTQDRLNNTLKKYGMELPQLKKCQTAPNLSRSKDKSRDPQKDMTPRQWLAKTMSCPSRRIYSDLYEHESYAAFCDRLVPLHEQNRAMKEDILTKIGAAKSKDWVVTKPKDDVAVSSCEHDSPNSSCSSDSSESSAAASSPGSPSESTQRHTYTAAASLPDPRKPATRNLRKPTTWDLTVPPTRGRSAVYPRESPAVCLRYCDDMSTYLLEHSRLYNCSVVREEQENLHNWEAYRRSCPVGNVTFVKGPDMVQLSYLAFHWFVCLCSCLFVFLFACYLVCLCSCFCPFLSILQTCTGHPTFISQQFILVHDLSDAFFCSIQTVTQYQN